MPANLQIRQIERGLSIRVTEGRSVRRILLNLAGAALFLYICLHVSSTSRIISIFVVGLCVFTVLKDIISAVRGTDVGLLVTNLDLISTGHAPDGYTPFTVSRADIYNLEFREATGGGDVSDSPRGLYVEHRGCTPWNSNSCVLPHIDEPQTEEVIKAICSRFPDTGNLPPMGPFEPYLTSLNLNTPKRD